MITYNVIDIIPELERMRVVVHFSNDVTKDFIFDINVEKETILTRLSDAVIELEAEEVKKQELLYRYIQLRNELIK